ncbi:hypothetical protein AAW14_06130 [Streptomyces hygroscopicus]|uniref:hypothetical protein n=1 Tax=Streptomyces hygroscopicus TaxID=1912 RepID=UPI00223EB9B9|nr:hypothetical protein [Streptomyces hygroscopicus]MCW7941623.1 hypothetical protein [Streptomyces hygroscopicus]
MTQMRERPFIAAHAREQRLTFTPPATETEFSTRRIDWYAVERAISGDHPRPHLNADEIREAALWLRSHGMPRATVSVHLSVYERLVKDWEADAGMLDPDQLCTTTGCRKARAGRGLCTTHLTAERQWRRALTEALGVAA